MTPAAVSLLLVHLKKGRFAGFGDGGGAEAAAVKVAADSDQAAAVEGGVISADVQARDVA